VNEIEQSVWRTVRALTVLAVLVVLLLAGISMINVVDLSLARGNRQPYEPIGAGVRVQSYAEIVPGVTGQTAHAWALGPDQQGNMSSNTIANQQEVSAAAASVWPRATVALLPQGRSALGDKEALAITPASVATPAPTEAPGATQPHLVIQIALANLRSGPGTEYPIVGIAPEGARYPITARYGDWWQVAARGSVAWVHSSLGMTEGEAGSVQAAVVVSAVEVVTPASSAPVPTLAPTATPTRFGNPLGAHAYSVETSRHPEANTVVIYALIQDNQVIVGDLFLLVEHNGQRWRSEPSSYAVQGVTKPSDPGSPYNRTYNAKIDFPLFLFPVLDPTGDWAITLVDGLGQPLSVISTINIAPNDPQQEIFLYYRRIKL
jgi:uncharacterized protein YraI